MQSVRRGKYRQRPFGDLQLFNEETGYFLPLAKFVPEQP
jgi:hypothetical protein